MKKTVAFALAVVALAMAAVAFPTLQLAVTNNGNDFMKPADYAINAFTAMGELALALAFVYLAAKLYLSKSKGFEFKASPYVLPPVAAGFALFAATMLLGMISSLADFMTYYWSWWYFAFQGVMLGVFLDVALAANAKFWETKQRKMVDVVFSVGAPEGKEPARKRRR